MPGGARKKIKTSRRIPHVPIRSTPQHIATRAAFHAQLFAEPVEERTVTLRWRAKYTRKITSEESDEACATQEVHYEDQSCTLTMSQWEKATKDMQIPTPKSYGAVDLKSLNKEQFFKILENAGVATDLPPKYPATYVEEDQEKNLETPETPVPIVSQFVTKESNHSTARRSNQPHSKPSSDRYNEELRTEKVNTSANNSSTDSHTDQIEADNEHFMEMMRVGLRNMVVNSNENDDQVDGTEFLVALKDSMVNSVMNGAVSEGALRYVMSHEPEISEAEMID